MHPELSSHTSDVDQSTIVMWSEMCKVLHGLEASHEALRVVSTTTQALRQHSQQGQTVERASEAGHMRVAGDTGPDHSQPRGNPWEAVHMACAEERSGKAAYFVVDIQDCRMGNTALVAAAANWVGSQKVLVLVLGASYWADLQALTAWLLGDGWEA